MAVNGDRHKHVNGGGEGRETGKGGGKVVQWKEGMKCLAKYWEDNEHYLAQVTALGPDTAVVMFTEYHNYEEVLLSDLQPLKGGSGTSGLSGIAPTPGLPPAFRQQ